MNLANYFPHQRSYNSVVFIHKKYLDDYKSPESKVKLKSKKDKKYKYFHDKGQQFNSDKYTDVSTNKTYKASHNNEQDVLDHTIRFAKNLVPLVIPQSDEKIPVFYTVKTTKRHRKVEKKHESSFDHQGTTQEEKGDSKKVFETYRKVRKESYSVRESLSQGSSNTLDDLNVNQSLCCTLSEVSEKKCHKRERSHHKKVNDGSKLVVSESFEALATENQGESKIKIHLMNEKDKNFLSDSIKAPILSALRECISEINNCNNTTDIIRLQKTLKSNTSKLDTILEKIACIENKLDSHAEEQKIEIRAPHAVEQKPEIRVPEKKLEILALEENSESVLVKKPLSAVPSVQRKPSALEELEEDTIESKDYYSSEEELHQESLYRRSKSAVTELVSEEKLGKRPPSSGCGEVGGLKGPYGPSAAVKPERPNRIPARFCWTDAARK